MFISYAQNFEDVLLWRVLKHIEGGFYIDIGAQDPDIDSVSRAFYERGWRGVHVEPIDRYVERLRAARPDEEVVQAAIATTEGVIPFFDIPDTGLSTGKASVAGMHERDGLLAKKIDVASMRLASLLDRYSDREIHWLKIDVEEMEKDVLESWSPSRVRPWVVVIESTFPRSPILSHSTWEPLITDLGYEFAYFDGLNRFYVHGSKREFKEKLGVGANFFDDFNLDINSYFARKIRGDLLAREAAIAEHMAEIDRLKQNEIVASSRHEQYASALHAALTVHAEKIETLESDVTAPDAMIAAHRAEIEVLRYSVEEARSQRDAMIAAHRAEIESLRHSVEKTRSQYEERLSDHKRRQADHQEELDALRHQIADLSADLTARDLQLVAVSSNAEATSQLAALRERELADVYASTSWRVTAPMRALSRATDWMMRRSRWFVQGAWAWLTLKPGSRPRRVARDVIVRTAGFVLARPRLVIAAKRVANHLPENLRRVLRSAASRSRSERAEHAGSVQLRPHQELFDRWASGQGPRVAVVAPVSPDGTVGGAERLYEGLVGAIRNIGGEADLITLPFDESSFESIKAGYAAFSSLDLSSYEVVISTKAPTFCVKHRNHILYLVHTIRVFYDMFDTAFPSAGEELLAQRRWIHQRDNEALRSIARRYAIGEEVAQRLKLFNGLSAITVHPGLNLGHIAPGPIGDYFFMPGRLHRWKRVDLAIRALRASSLPMKLVIAGSGEEDAALRALAENDERISFAGYVDDARLADLYRGCLGVIFCPVSEDYGYVTIEAFAYAKPVITCSDSGEPLQFVKNGETGLVSQPDTDSLRGAMERLWIDRNEAREMGLEGADLARSIKWENVARTLLDETSEVALPIHIPKIKVAVLDMQPITPAVGGGRLRLFGLYHNLGRRFQTRYIGSYDWPGEMFRQEQLSETLTEIVVPLSKAHHDAAEDAQKKAGGRVVIDMLFGVQGNLSQEYFDEARRAVQWADVVIFSHPWVAPLISENFLHGKFVVYDSHNVEIDLREQLLSRENPFQAYVLDQVEWAERMAGDRADLILACSAEDAVRFSDKYDWPASRIELVPNGVFSRKIAPITTEERAALKARLGLSVDRCVAFFIGSDYAPNVEAAKIVIDSLAPSCGEILFVIAGGVCRQLPVNVPRNVRIAGELSESDKVYWLRACDIAVNPMLSGSGTNIKMFDFAAAGLPIVTTDVGARGITEASSYGIEVCTLDHMPVALTRYAADPALRKKAGADNRRLIEARFSWERLSPQLGHALKEAVFRERGRRKRLSCMNEASRRVLHFSTVGQRCGIGEYTLHLIEKMRRCGFEPIVFTCATPVGQPDLRRFEGNARIAWFHDSADYAATRLSDDIDSLIDAAKAELAVVQHHPGFLGPADLLKLVKLLIGNEVPTAVIVHALVDSQMPLMRELAAAGAVVVSHKREDLLELQRHGVEGLHLPLAVPSLSSAPKSASSAKTEYTVVSNGFLRDHKGIEIIVEAFSLLRETIPEARLHLYCSRYPSGDSDIAYNKVVEAIRRNSLEAYVEFDTDYKDKNALLDMLSDADVAVFAYSESAEGGSAAAADAIAAGVPVIVSPSAIFDDLRDTALTCPAQADAIASALKSIQSDPALYRRLAAQSRAYAERNSWEVVVDTLSGALS